MSHSRSRKLVLSPLVVRVIELAQYAEAHDASVPREGHAAFLEAISQLAAQNVGFRGVLAPDPALYGSIEGAAKQHLDWNEAKKDVLHALDGIVEFRRRDAIESAYSRLVDVSDTSYYYTGLAFGLTLADLAGRR
jgi:hypothetical protein